MRKGSRKEKHSFAKTSPAPLAFMQAVFVERVEILSITTKTKTLEVKGGFYSVDDMKDELKYNQHIVLKNQGFFADTMYVNRSPMREYPQLQTSQNQGTELTRLWSGLSATSSPGSMASDYQHDPFFTSWQHVQLTFSETVYLLNLGFWNLRKCEYDDDTYEYWVNTRTEGSLKREDVERLTRKREHEQEVEADDALPTMDFSAGGFQDDLGTAGALEQEGDAHKSVACMHES